MGGGGQILSPGSGFLLGFSLPELYLRAQQSLSRVRPSVTPWTAAHQAPVHHQLRERRCFLPTLNKNVPPLLS